MSTPPSRSEIAEQVRMRLEETFEVDGRLAVYFDMALAALMGTQTGIGGAMTKTDTLRGSRPIKPIGRKIIEHPRLEEWIATGQARQLHDGLWLHYAVVCSLLNESEPTEAEIEEVAREIVTMAFVFEGDDLLVEVVALLREYLVGTKL